MYDSLQIITRFVLAFHILSTFVSQHHVAYLVCMIRAGDEYLLQLLLDVLHL